MTGVPTGDLLGDRGPGGAERRGGGVVRVQHRGLAMLDQAQGRLGIAASEADGELTQLKDDQARGKLLHYSPRGPAVESGQPRGRTDSGRAPGRRRPANLV